MKYKIKEEKKWRQTEQPHFAKNQVKKTKQKHPKNGNIGCNV